ncbi:MAG TPA: polysaccharide biosynthesis/export family protein [Thermoguttaceae bacterium]|nr:polysaccharide biosynthesis/export family protein [Thermoguttaceae bacterium]
MLRVLALVSLGLFASGGCWAPFVSPAIPACSLPDSFRTPIRTAGPPLNLASLSIPPQPDYILGPGDVLEVAIHDLYPGQPVHPVRVEVMGNGQIHLPIVGAVSVEGKNLMQAHVAINTAYADGFMKDPRTNVFLAEKASTSVLVLGEVGAPGMYRLPKYENDVAHALAAAGGLMEDAGLELQVHRRIPPGQVVPAGYQTSSGGEPGTTLQVLTPPEPGVPSSAEVSDMGLSTVGMMESAESPLGVPLADEPTRIVRIPLNGLPAQPIYSSDIVLNAGDVVVVPSRKDEVFYVVGKLSPTNFTRFSISERERDIGAGFLLPRDREIDVVTAVAMAGYIDPIDSPTTVTVHRHCANGQTMLINVDLIKARYNPKETVLVSAGDIIYLNPDAAWWARRTFDRIIPSLFDISYRKALGFSR